MAVHGPQRLNAGGTSREPASDEALAAQAALADEAAFEQLVRRHERRIRALLWRFTRDRALADELCQETFLRAWRKLGSFQGRGRFGAWLAALAYNVFLKERRGARRYAGTTSQEDPAIAPALAEAETAHSSEAGPATLDLDRLLAVVSEEERELLTLSYAAGLSATEIGAMLGTAPGTVKSQIHRAKQKIRRAFDIETVP